ncbi:hypothetical protein KR51_00036800 [Rubidibacter lacunae KORDI 51-2]|uniref:Uncharacterized protein n=1 Tax=Rubidibacter lacunae KORDI 51-2 TaxID=582515 RepID=U5DF12_9CHRO|nr:hypothetical protein KR51_00036800 [Rubidibacter lacunae KORDI 51-2]
MLRGLSADPYNPIGLAQNEVQSAMGSGKSELTAAR